MSSAGVFKRRDISLLSACNSSPSSPDLNIARRSLPCQILGETQKRHLIWVNCGSRRICRLEASQHGCRARGLGKTAHPIEGTSSWRPHPCLTATSVGRCARTASGRLLDGCERRRRSNGFPTMSRRSSIGPAVVKLDMAGVRELDTLGAWLLEKMSRRATVRRSPCRYRRHRRQLCRPDRRGSSGQPANAGAGSGAQSRRGEARRYRSRHHRCERRHRRIPADAGRALHRHPGRPAPAAIAAADVADLPALSRRLAGDTDRRADHLPDRRHHRAAGHFPFPQVRRGFLRRRHGRHSRAARTRRADRRHHGRRPFGQRLYRRTRLDEDARGNRRAFDHGAGPDRGPDAAADPGAGLSRCRS